MVRYAIKTALNTCKNLSLDKVKKIHILSDCQSAITSVVNNKASKCHQDVINDTNKMAKDFSDKNIEVVLSWIGGHSDILGNHLADTAAKNGANKPENKQTKITLKIAKNIIKSLAIEHWQKKWRYSTTGSHLKNIQQIVSVGSSTKYLKNRKTQISLHQIKIGRSRLNGQDPINKKERTEKLCCVCNTFEDTEHFMLHCQRYSIQRREMFLKIEATLEENNLSNHEITNSLLFLAENKTLPSKARGEIYMAIGNFIETTKRL